MKFDLLQIMDKDTQADRDREQYDDEGCTGKYAELKLESMGRDCDGRHYTKPVRYLVSEEELPYMLASHFGVEGWNYEQDGQEIFLYKHMKTDEGYHNLDAHIYFPDIGK